MIERVVVDVNCVDWASFFLVGWAALLFPSLSRKELQCNPCGEIFQMPPEPIRGRDRLIGLVLGGLSILMILLVIWVVFFGMAGLSG